MVATYTYRIGQSFKEALAIVPHRVCDAMNRPSGPFDARAERFAYDLVAQAHTEDRNARYHRMNERDTHACVHRPTRPRREHDAARGELEDLGHRYHVALHDLYIRGPAHEAMHQVPRKRVVIVDHQQHQVL
jgi:hypothetical protein